MRFYKNSQDTERTIERYAWYPIIINYQLRWFENVKIKQHCRKLNNGYEGEFIKGISMLIVILLTGGYWEDIQFMDPSIDDRRNEKLKKLGI